MRSLMLGDCLHYKSPYMRGVAQAMALHRRARSATPTGSWRRLFARRLGTAPCVSTCKSTCYNYFITPRMESVIFCFGENFPPPFGIDTVTSVVLYRPSTQTISPSAYDSSGSASASHPGHSHVSLALNALAKHGMIVTRRRAFRARTSSTTTRRGTVLRTLTRSGTDASRSRSVARHCWRAS